MNRQEECRRSCRKQHQQGKQRKYRNRNHWMIDD
jgi:hypothetical protein